MPDQSEPTAPGLVAAVLAVMPIRNGHDTVVEYRQDRFDAWKLNPLYGDPEPLAAKYVAVVLRAAADELDPDHHNIEGIVRWMRRRVDEIEQEYAR